MRENYPPQNQPPDRRTQLLKKLNSLRLEMVEVLLDTDLSQGEYELIRAGGMAGAIFIGKADRELASEIMENPNVEIANLRNNDTFFGLLDHAGKSVLKDIHFISKNFNLD